MKAGTHSLALALLALYSGLGEAAIRATTHRRGDIVDPVEHDRRRHGFSSAATKFRRADTVSADLRNDITLYYINITLGTPPQDFLLHIDTGSSDLWVNTASSSFCQAAQSGCAQAGVYSSSDSTTYKFVNNDFNVSYADSSSAAGPYVSDTLTVGGTTLQNFQFGIGETSNTAQGILGVGYSTNEGVVQTSSRLIYPNLPLALANAGATQSAAFSLWLNDLDASEGTILFGGVDTSKYTGELVTLPVVQVYGGYSQFLVPLTGMGTNGNANSLVSNQAVAVLLDSGTSLTYLPQSITTALYQAYDTSYNENYGVAFVPCSLADNSGSVDFTFAGLTISVGLDELVINISNNPRATQCAFGIAPSSAIGGLTVLGDSFLRSAYVVYDISNNQISMAQTNFNSTADNVVAISSGTNGVPNATPASTITASIAASITGPIGSAQTSDSGSVNGGPAGPLITAAPLWKVGGGIAAGAAALAFL